MQARWLHAANEGDRVAALCEQLARQIGLPCEAERNDHATFLTANRRPDTHELTAA